MIATNSNMTTINNIIISGNILSMGDKMISTSYNIPHTCNNLIASMAS